MSKLHNIFAVKRAMREWYTPGNKLFQKENYKCISRRLIFYYNTFYVSCLNLVPRLFSGYRFLVIPNYTQERYPDPLVTAHVHTLHTHTQLLLINLDKPQDKLHGLSSATTPGTLNPLCRGQSITTQSFLMNMSTRGRPGSGEASQTGGIAAYTKHTHLFTQLANWQKSPDINKHVGF